MWGWWWVRQVDIQSVPLSTQLWAVPPSQSGVWTLKWQGCCGLFPLDLWGGVKPQQGTPSWRPALCHLLCAHWGPGELPQPCPTLCCPHIQARIPRGGSDLHKGFLSALPGGESIREALCRPLTCGFRRRAWGIYTMAFSLFFITLLTLCSGVWLWKAQGMIMRTHGWGFPSSFWEHLVGDNLRLTCVCLHCSVAGSWAQSSLTQEASLSASVGQEVTLNCAGNDNNVGTYYVGWYQQVPGSAPKTVMLGTTRPSGIPDRFSGSHSGNKASLIISRLWPEDEADYYCSTWDKGINNYTVLQAHADLWQKSAPVPHGHRETVQGLRVWLSDHRTTLKVLKWHLLSLMLFFLLLFVKMKQNKTLEIIFMHKVDSKFTI